MTGGAGGPARLALLVAVAVIFQVSWLAQMPMFGGAFDLLPLLVAAVALYAGSVPAMVTAFGAGLLLDMAVGGDVGAASLVLVAVAYGVGRSCEVRQPSHALAPLLIAVIATAAWVSLYAAVSFMLEVDAAVSALVLREMVVTVILNALIALPVFALIRRVLRPVLAVDPDALRRRRRRARPRERGPIGLRGLEV